MITIIVKAPQDTQPKLAKSILERISEVSSALVNVLPGGFDEEVSVEVRAYELNGNAALVERVRDAAFDGIRDVVEVSTGIVCNVDGHPDLTKIRQRYIGVNG